jgi:hypothetical protein
MDVGAVAPPVAPFGTDTRTWYQRALNFAHPESLPKFARPLLHLLPLLRA